MPAALCRRIMDFFFELRGEQKPSKHLSRDPAAELVQVKVYLVAIAHNVGAPSRAPRIIQSPSEPLPMAELCFQFQRQPLKLASEARFVHTGGELEGSGNL